MIVPVLILIFKCENIDVGLVVLSTKILEQLKVSTNYYWFFGLIK